MIFKEKCFSHYILLTDQISCLITFASCDIWQYVYSNFLLSNLLSEILKSNRKKLRQKWKYINNENSF